MQKIRVIIANPDGEYKLMESNKGAEAVIISSIEILRHFFPNAEFMTTFQLSEDLSQILDCKVMRNKIFSVKTYSLYTSLKSTIDLLRCILWKSMRKYVDLKFLMNRKLMEYLNCDVLIHLGMDLYSDDFGFLTVVEHSKDILLGLILGKPVVIWAESVGPFSNRLTRHLAKFTLKRVSLITLREEVSGKYLEDLGISEESIWYTADPAFLLKPQLNHELKNISEPIVGVSLSYLAGESKKSKRFRFLEAVAKMLKYILPDGLSKIIMERGKSSNFYGLSKTKYIDLMAKLIDHVIEEFNCSVLLIPHEEPLIGEDIHKEIWKKIQYKTRVVLIPFSLKAREIKGIISQCDLFVGGKMHSCIAALSQSIPTVGLAYSHKFQGIMTQLGQENYVCTEITFDEMIEKIRNAWKRRNEIKIELTSQLEKMKNLALLNGKLVKALLET